MYHPVKHNEIKIVAWRERESNMYKSTDMELLKSLLRRRGINFQEVQTFHPNGISLDKKNAFFTGFGVYAQIRTPC